MRSLIGLCQQKTSSPERFDFNSFKSLNFIVCYVRNGNIALRLVVRRNFVDAATPANDFTVAKVEAVNVPNAID
jgi:hypothetical protein